MLRQFKLYSNRLLTAALFQNQKRTLIPRNVRQTFSKQTEDNKAEDNKVEVSELLSEAQVLEKQGKLREAEQIYKNVIYNIEPSRKDAYDLLIRLWVKKGPFSMRESEVQPLFEQYQQHVKKEEHSEDVPDALKKGLSNSKG